MLYLFIFFTLFLFMLLYFKIANKYKIIDNPNHRSSHSTATIRGGGVIFWISICQYAFFSNVTYPFFFIGLTVISTISFIDDLKSLPNWIRLVFQFISVSFIFFEIQLHTQINYILIIPFLIFSVGVLNAYNFMDGINGMTGLYSSVLIFSFWFINSYQIRFIENDFLYFIFISLQVFNIFNFRTKAKCFAGDIGSISIATIIIFILYKLIIATNSFSYILFLSIYGVDTIQTLILRIFRKENIFKAHKTHLFQLLVSNGSFSQLNISSIYSLLQLISNIFVLILLKIGLGFLPIVLIVLLPLSLIFILIRLNFSTKTI